MKRYMTESRLKECETHLRRARAAIGQAEGEREDRLARLIESLKARVCTRRRGARAAGDSVSIHYVCA